MSWQDYAGLTSRTPCTLVVITLDTCSLVFGEGLCTATGAPCYNTYYTCKATPAYQRTTKNYEFTSADSAPPWAGPRPYLKEITLLPTEIKEAATVSGRLKITLYDEPDTDIGIDPYVNQRTQIFGTFWKKLLARNPNYKGRQVRVFDGFLGMAPADFVERGRGNIDTVSIKEGSITIECADALKDLNEIKIPPQLAIALISNITASDVSITLDTTAGLDSPAGYVRVSDEIISYTGINAPANMLTGCTRGVFSTVAVAHAAADAVNKVRYYPPLNPFDRLKNILTEDCGLTSSEYDESSFDYWRDWPGGDIPVKAIITEPTSARDLIFELVDMLDCAMWVAEDLKITIRRNIPNEPGRSYRLLTDDANISIKNRSVDINEDYRYTRVILYWDKSILGKSGEVASYRRVDIGVDPEAESANGYGDQIAKTIYSRWISSGYLQEEILDGYIRDFVRRRLLNICHARPIISISVELKDGSIKTGEYLLMQTDEMLQTNGIPISERFQVIKREHKGAVIDIKAARLGSERLCLISPDDIPDYDDSGIADKEYGFISDDSGRIDDKPGYVIW